MKIDHYYHFSSFRLENEFLYLKKKRMIELSFKAIVMKFKEDKQNLIGEFAKVTGLLDGIIIDSNVEARGYCMFKELLGIIQDCMDLEKIS